MDEIDVAAERTEYFNAAAIRTALSSRQTRPSTGICVSCQDDIEAERLRANPHALHCCDCANEEEALRRRARLCGPG